VTEREGDRVLRAVLRDRPVEVVAPAPAEREVRRAVETARREAATRLGGEVLRRGRVREPRAVHARRGLRDREERTGLVRPRVDRGEVRGGEHGRVDEVERELAPHLTHRRVRERGEDRVVPEVRDRLDRDGPRAVGGVDLREVQRREVDPERGGRLGRHVHVVVDRGGARDVQREPRGPVADVRQDDVERLRPRGEPFRVRGERVEPARRGRGAVDVAVQRVVERRVPGVRHPRVVRGRVDLRVPRDEVRRDVRVHDLRRAARDRHARHVVVRGGAGQRRLEDPGAERGLEGEVAARVGRVVLEDDVVVARGEQRDPRARDRLAARARVDRALELADVRQGRYVVELHRGIGDAGQRGLVLEDPGRGLVLGEDRVRLAGEADVGLGRDPHAPVARHERAGRARGGELELAATAHDRRGVDRPRRPGHEVDLYARRDRGGATPRLARVADQRVAGRCGAGRSDRCKCRHQHDHYQDPKGGSVEVPDQRFHVSFFGVPSDGAARRT